jgi:hypothetical protein
VTKFELAERLKDLIDNRSLYEVVEFEESDASMTVKVGKKKFIVKVIMEV